MPVRRLGRAVTRPLRDWIVDAGAEVAAADVIVVPGCRVYADGSASPALERRVARAAELFHDAVAPQVAISGGGVPSEAVVGARLLDGLGVPGEALVVEPRARTTRENAHFLREMLGDVHVLVVTDDTHLWRCRGVFLRYFSAVSCAAVETPHTTGRTLRELRSILTYSLRGPGS